MLAKPLFKIKWNSLADRGAWLDERM